ncbi:MBL fold metallo-hydrolase [Sanguibacter antarcticus]|uniref:Ribonuclease BN (tRNA processing enzyme) n=1 Tax=Sanguibacter antarcticus TaxID=372484 RepID=A0A2A9E4V6_9MICO|nr:MBL fold metallo-hydrolase [Sanguibacter antarcticus]PFG33666.1 ribonuclease BN (tRNA processing enzyme) [Sanguibacter antarcticus]
MKLTIVGMAGSFPSPSSPASCYLVQADDAAGRTWSLLLDLGSGSLGALQQILDPFDVDAVAITHTHPDHFADLCGYYVYRKYHPVRGSERDASLRPTPVHGPSDTESRVAEAYGLPADERMTGQLAFAAWEPGVRVSVGPLEIEPFVVEHPVQAYGFRVTGPSTTAPGTRATLAYTGDTDSCPALVGLAAGVDLFLAEAAFVEGRDTVRGIHLTGRRAGLVAQEAGAARLLLTHVPAWNDPEVSLAEARSVYTGAVDLAVQGAVHVL